MTMPGPIGAGHVDARGLVALIAMALRLSPAEGDLLASGLALLLSKLGEIAGGYARAAHPRFPQPLALRGAT